MKWNASMLAGVRRMLAGQKNKKSRKTRRPALEALEARQLMAVDLRSIDGTGNNVAHPDWGSTEEAFLRLAPAEYADGANTPAGDTRLSAREISNLVVAHPAEELLNDRDMSAFVFAWGQFLDHDIDLTPATSAPAEAFPIPVPTGDPFFDPTASGTQTIPLTRSLYDAATGTVDDPREQVNRITAFIDGSQVYGSDPTTALNLRTLSGGRLKTSEGNLLPTDESGQFFAGDIRVNENPFLTSLHTLFVREHNRLADQFATRNPTWTDEQIFQAARRIVVAQLQQITYQEFLPALLGSHALDPYRGYNPEVNPGISNEFATAGFRLGHSLLRPEIGFLDNDGNPIRDEMALRDAFFNTGVLSQTDIGPVLKYLASDRTEELDVMIIDDVRNFLFGPPGAGGFDLASLNIQRGRDHGLADYNQVREALGLPRVDDFADITSNPAVEQALRDAYGSVDEVDLWVGGLAEDHLPGSSVGPTFQRILVDQFTRLRDGDRFFYQRDLSKAELRQVQQTSLADLIRRNTTISNLQENVFFFRPAVSGRVFADANANGHAERPEAGLAGITVQLRNADGDVVASTQTDDHGRYSLAVPELGTYTLDVQAPGNFRQTTRLSSLEFTRGQSLDGVDVGLTTTPRRNDPPRPAPLPPPPGPGRHDAPHHGGPLAAVDQVFSQAGSPQGPSAQSLGSSGLVAAAVDPRLVDLVLGSSVRGTENKSKNR